MSGEDKGAEWKIHDDEAPGPASNSKSSINEKEQVREIQSLPGTKPLTTLDKHSISLKNGGAASGEDAQVELERHKYADLFKNLENTILKVVNNESSKLDCCPQSAVTNVSCPSSEIRNGNSIKLLSFIQNVI